MGLSNNDSNATFLSTFDGYFEMKLKEPKPGSVQRVNKNNDTINVMRFNTLTGKIIKVEYKVTEKYGDFWSITIVDDRTYKLDLPVNSSSTFYFLNRLINEDLDLKAPVELKVRAEVENDKKKTIILIKQGGKTIIGVYSKKNPGDLPAMEQIMFKGKLQWDSTKRDTFLRGIIETYICPELEGHVEASAEGADMAPDGPQDDTEMPDWAKPEDTAPMPEAPAPVAPVAPAPVAKEAPKKAPAKARGAK